MFIIAEKTWPLFATIDFWEACGSRKAADTLSTYEPPYQGANDMLMVDNVKDKDFFSPLVCGNASTVADAEPQEKWAQLNLLGCRHYLP